MKCPVRTYVGDFLHSTTKIFALDWFRNKKENKPILYYSRKQTRNVPNLSLTPPGLILYQLSIFTPYLLCFYYLVFLNTPNFVYILFITDCITHSFSTDSACFLVSPFNVL